MGLRGTLQKAAQATIKALGDVREEITYRSLTSAVYDAEAGTAPLVEATTTLKAIVGSFKRNELGAKPTGVEGRDPVEITTSDKKVVIASLDLPGVTPKTSDRVTLADGAEWEVFYVHTDAAGAAWTLGVRLP